MSDPLRISGKKDEKKHPKILGSDLLMHCNAGHALAADHWNPNQVVADALTIMDNKGRLVGLMACQTAMTMNCFCHACHLLAVLGTSLSIT